MKKYFIIAVAAMAAMAACAKTEIDETAVPDQKISFEVGSYKAQTKANVALTNGEDALYSFHTYANQFPELGNPVNFMDVDILPWNINGTARTQVTKPAANETAADIHVWAPAEDYYWPKTGYINFYSYAGTESPAVGVNTSGDWKTVTFTYADKVIDANSNILVADPALHYGISNAQTATYNVDNSENSGHVTKGVPTLFRHQLSKIVFDVRARTTTDKVSANTNWKIQVLGTYTPTSGSAIKSAIKPVNKGSLLLTNVDGNTSAGVDTWVRTNEVSNADNVSGWIPSSTSTDKEEIVFTETAAIANAPAVLTIPVNAIEATTGDPAAPYNPVVLVESRAVMPQLTTGVDFTLVYKVQALHGTTVFMEEIRTVGISTAATLSQLINNVPKWEANKKITYHIIIDPVSEKVTFDPAVVEWEDDVNNGDVINVNNGGLVTNP